MSRAQIEEFEDDNVVDEEEEEETEEDRNEPEPEPVMEMVALKKYRSVIKKSMANWKQIVWSRCIQTSRDHESR